MKHFNFFLYFIFCTFFLTSVVGAQHISVISGVSDKNDTPHKMIATNDGHYIMVGQVSNDAALYKFNCKGETLDSLRKDLAVDASFETFYDALEMANGDLIAVGGASTLDGSVNAAAVIRVDRQLSELAFDTFKVNGKSANIRHIVRLKDGRVMVAGHLAGSGFDFTDIFLAELNPATLQLQGLVSVFSYGVDDLHGVSPCSDGGAILSGVSVLGNIFLPEANLENRAFIRKVKANGTLEWERIEKYTFKNKWGRAYFQQAVENPSTGRFVAVGTRFTGDTIQPLDIQFYLLKPNGDSVDRYKVAMKGSQHMHDMIHFTDGLSFFIAVGDSTGAVEAGTDRHAPLACVMAEVNSKILPVNIFTDQTTPFLSFRSVVSVPAVRFALTGKLYWPGGGGNNEDIATLIPQLGVRIDKTGQKLNAVINPPGTYQYQWLKDGQPIPGATSAAYTPTTNGVYTVKVSDPTGCRGEQGVVSAKALELSGFQIYPNPADDYLHIDGFPEAPCQLDLFDASGRLVRPMQTAWSGGPLQMDLSQTASGIYYLRLLSAEGVAMKRIVVRH